VAPSHYEPGSEQAARAAGEQAPGPGPRPGEKQRLEEEREAMPL